jgi:hypothetical protein
MDDGYFGEGGGKGLRGVAFGPDGTDWIPPEQRAREAAMNNRMMDTPESTNTFPTPAELDAKRRAKAAAEVAAALAKIRATLEATGPGMLYLDASSPARDEVTRILTSRGWAVEWGSDQRDGSWVMVTPRAPRQTTNTEWEIP